MECENERMKGMAVLMLTLQMLRIYDHVRGSLRPLLDQEANYIGWFIADAFSEVSALVEALSGSMGASVSAVDATNTADAGAQPAAAPSFSFGAMKVQQTAPAAQQSQTQQVPDEQLHDPGTFERSLSQSNG